MGFKEEQTCKEIEMEIDDWINTHGYERVKHERKPSGEEYFSKVRVIYKKVDLVLDKIKQFCESRDRKSARKSQNRKKSRVKKKENRIYEEFGCHETNVENSTSLQ